MNIPVSQERFSGFTEDERSILHLALQLRAKRIMDKAVAEEFEQADLNSAAEVFYLASSMVDEVGATLGLEPAGGESLAMVALAIAEGEAPLAARMAAEVEEPTRPLGAHADVSVTPGEDELIA
jgi:hypothetical protein